MANVSLQGIALGMTLAALLMAGCAAEEPAVVGEQAGDEQAGNEAAGEQSVRSRARRIRAAAKKSGASAASTAALEQVRDSGDFQVRYARRRGAEYQEWEEVFKETQLLEVTAAELNGVFALPADVPVVLRECGEVNAFYDPETQEISLCYEMIEDLAAVYFAEDQTDEEAEEAGTAVANALMFTFYHELGHALIDLYDLPITGREEDAVDQLATMILLEGGDEGEDAAIDGANSFVSDEETEIEDLSFWDEHSLDDQRFYNILCWIYGKNPKDYEYLVEDETLPADRAARCPGEYQRMSRSWDALLTPYVKE